MNENTNLNIYILSRYFWDFAFENPVKIKPIHCSIYFFAVEHCNRLGWKKNFGLPTSMVIEAIGVKSYSVYKSAFDDLVSFGFFEIIQYSKNQYSSNVIALKENDKADDKANSKALDKALIKHVTKQCESTVQSIDSIIIQLTRDKEQLTNKQLIALRKICEFNKDENQDEEKQIISCFSFDEFWKAYAKFVGKIDCGKLYLKIKEPERLLIKNHLPIYLASVNNKKYQMHPLKYLKGKYWNDIEESELEPKNLTIEHFNTEWKELVNSSISDADLKIKANELKVKYKDVFEKSKNAKQNY
jgi:hypothetical protein